MSAAAWVKDLIARGILRLHGTRLMVRKESYGELSDLERRTLKQEKSAIVTLLGEESHPDPTVEALSTPDTTLPDDIDNDPDWGLRSQWKHLPRDTRIFERNAQRIRRRIGWEMGEDIGIARDGTAFTHGLSNSNIDPTAEMLESLRRERRGY